MKMLWTDRRLFAGIVAMCLLSFFASRSSSPSDFVWAIVSIVGIIGGSNAWQASQIAKYANKIVGEEVDVREKQNSKNPKHEPKAKNE
jgi:hypothetical protein